MNLPPAFVDRMKRDLGEDTYRDFETALQKEPSISLRLHPLKCNLTPDLEKVEWSDRGYYLKERPLFSSDPLWHAGVYYVQEASSMMLEPAFLKAKSLLQGPLKILDLCAA